MPLEREATVTAPSTNKRVLRPLSNPAIHLPRRVDTQVLLFGNFLVCDRLASKTCQIRASDGNQRALVRRTDETETVRIFVWDLSGVVRPVAVFLALFVIFVEVYFNYVAVGVRLQAGLVNWGFQQFYRSGRRGMCLTRN